MDNDICTVCETSFKSESLPVCLKCGELVCSDCLTDDKCGKCNIESIEDLDDLEENRICEGCEEEIPEDEQIVNVKVNDNTSRVCVKCFKLFRKIMFNVGVNI